MASLQRLAVQRSPVYKAAGIRSYAYAMTKCTHLHIHSHPILLLLD